MTREDFLASLGAIISVFVIAWILLTGPQREELDVACIPGTIRVHSTCNFPITSPAYSEY